MAGEEIFTANSILVIAIIAPLLAIYLVNRKETPFLSDMCLIGIFLTLSYGVRVMGRAFTVIDPTGQLDLIIWAFYSVFTYATVGAVLMMLARIIINIKTLLTEGKWETYER